MTQIQLFRVSSQLENNAFRILSLLDQKSLYDFEDSYEDRQTYPKWVDLQKFLQKRAVTFEANFLSKEAPSSSAGDINKS